MTILSEVNTLAKAASALANGDVSSAELTEACIERCAVLEPRLSAFITIMADEALAMARAADERRKNADAITPVTGIPLAFKDIIDVAGIRATGHSRLYADRIARKDAEVVARLRAQGAVFLGKVTTNEFAIGAHDETALAPNARNPWNTNHTPGGSSSGSAVSVAANEVFGALGTDTGGSIRVPAAFNGIVGVKPSRGIVSRKGIMPLSEHVDTVGPMTRTVEDAALLLDAIATPETDQAAAPLSASGGFHAALSSMPDGAGYVRVRDFDARLPEAQRRALDEAEILLQSLGVAARGVGFPDIEELDAISAVIATCESWSYHRERLAAYPDLYGRDARIKLHLGALVSGDDYLLAKARQKALVDAFERQMGPADILLVPTTLGAAPARSPAGGAIRFGHWSHIGPNGFANALGGPVVALPCGVDQGLPLSIQLIGRYGSDAAVLSIAHTLEAAIKRANLAPPDLALN